MGNEDAEHVDTDWSGRPAARRRGWPKMKMLEGGAILVHREDGTWEPVTDLVVKVINGRRYTQDDDGKWYPVDDKWRVGKDPVDPYADEGKEKRRA